MRRRLLYIEQRGRLRKKVKEGEWNKRLTLIIQSPGKVGSYKFSETECSSEFVWTRDDVYCEDGTIADVFCESERRDAERDEKRQMSFPKLELTFIALSAPLELHPVLTRAQNPPRSLCFRFSRSPVTGAGVKGLIWIPQRGEERHDRGFREETRSCWQRSFSPAGARPVLHEAATSDMSYEMPEQSDNLKLRTPS
ncbi:hypothetical protein RRG08_012174 [Elysia crispata]|uniref:Uncharacterized protein n=1 Tax=Elysia crispata TaxID=231223 RepID=A0AAE1DH72_9GAST|nr:hypothetical protein RRG08_012174 [Elysia crispata]